MNDMALIRLLSLVVFFASLPIVHAQETDRTHCLPAVAADSSASERDPVPAAPVADVQALSMPAEIFSFCYRDTLDRNDFSRLHRSRKKKKNTISPTHFNWHMVLMTGMFLFDQSIGKVGSRADFIIDEDGYPNPGVGVVKQGKYRNTASGIYATEYHSQSMLSLIKSRALNDYGYTGKGVRVAVADSGIDAGHPEFNSKTIYGTDFSFDFDSYGSDASGHGTHVASIIAGDRDTQGMRGIAYNATLYSYRLANSRDAKGVLSGINSDAETADLFAQHVRDNIDVSNNSWGFKGDAQYSYSISLYDERAVRGMWHATIFAIRAAQKNGTLMVFSAGNDKGDNPDYFTSMPYYVSELMNEWLVVVAVDSTLYEASYSTRCGVTRAFCVAAPGGDRNGGILAAQANSTGYAYRVGTSMAAPHVSGLAALLMEKFPELTPAEIATRLKETATYAGLTTKTGETLRTVGVEGMQAVFGHGLVDGEAAAAMIGTASYPIGNTLAGAVNLSEKKLALPVGISLATQRKLTEQDFVVFDSFDDAHFLVDGTALFAGDYSVHTPLYGQAEVFDTWQNSASWYPGVAGTGVIRTAASAWLPRFIAAGQSDELQATGGFWGEKSRLFGGPAVLHGVAASRYTWDQPFLGGRLRPFVQLDTGDHDNAIGAYGASFSAQLSDHTQVVGSFRKARQYLQNGLLAGTALPTNAEDWELGMVHHFTAGENAFFRMATSGLEDVAPGRLSYGLQGARADTWTLGYETVIGEGKLAVGVTRSYELAAGTIALLTPVTRTRDGEILYTVSDFPILREDRLERFIAYRYRKKHYALSLGLVEDRYDYGTLGAVQFRFSSTF